jgi:ion channel-forming bestrophin family protein
MIWVNVGLPPTDETPPYIKGKTPTTNVTASQLRRRKIETLKLALAFTFATKHYLRGEDGTAWDDYSDILPASITRSDELGHDAQTTVTPVSYSATRESSKTPSRDGEGRSGRASPAEVRVPDATKRVRVKRSKPTVAAGPNAPLLVKTHQSVEFHGFDDHLTLPLPLLFVSFFALAADSSHDIYLLE